LKEKYQINRKEEKMSKNNICILIILLSMTLMNSCRKITTAAQTGDTAEIKNNYLEINVNIGPHYFLKKYGFLKSNHKPQTVIWIEDNEGKFIDTIFMTRLGATGTWENDDVKRPSCFPIWSYKRGIETMPGYYMPTRKMPLPDSITASTPSNNFKIKWKIPENLKKGLYRLNLEINSSYDFNKTYNNKNKTSELYHPFDGQPSLLWSNTIEINDKQNSNELLLVGHGDIKGDNGSINDDISKITSAKNMIKSVAVKYFQ